MINNIILFDGVCNLCNKTVQIIIRLDKEKIFRFTSLQSEFGKKLLKEYKVPKTDSVVLIQNQKAYIKSDAILKIGKSLGKIYKIIGIAYLFPQKTRNKIYDFIAQKRYVWFGKKNSCIIPTEELKKRFLE